MKIQPYLDKLSSSKEFKTFLDKNPKSYFAAGFFVLDFQEKKNLHQIDYYLPAKKRMVTFTLDSKVELKESPSKIPITPKKIDGTINLDLDILKGLVEDEMKNNTITTKIQKIIAVLQNVNGKKVWNLNCITSDMGLIKAHIDDETHSILKFERVNLFDIMRKI